MTFDIEKVYTEWDSNALEGALCICADTLSSLRTFVTDDNETTACYVEHNPNKNNAEMNEYPFKRVGSNLAWKLAYKLPSEDIDITKVHTSFEPDMVGMTVICADSFRELERRLRIKAYNLYKVEGAADCYDKSIAFRTMRLCDSMIGVYRIVYEMPSTMCTNKELQKWLAQGKGQMRYGDEAGLIFSSISAHDYDEDKEVEPFTEIRPWGSDKWIPATKEAVKDEQ